MKEGKQDSEVDYQVDNLNNNILFRPDPATLLNGCFERVVNILRSDKAMNRIISTIRIEPPAKVG